MGLCIWAYVPHNGRDIRIGFPGIEQFPDKFLAQNLNGIRSTATTTNNNNTVPPDKSVQLPTKQEIDKPVHLSVGPED